MRTSGPLLSKFWLRLGTCGATIAAVIAATVLRSAATMRATPATSLVLTTAALSHHAEFTRLVCLTSEARANRARRWP